MFKDPARGPARRAVKEMQMEKEELLRLAYIKLAKAAEILQMAGEEALAEEAEAIADKVDRAATAEAAHPSPVEVKARR